MTGIEIQTKVLVQKWDQFQAEQGFIQRDLVTNYQGQFNEAVRIIYNYKNRMDQFEEATGKPAYDLAVQQLEDIAESIQTEKRELASSAAEKQRLRAAAQEEGLSLIESTDLISKLQAAQTALQVVRDHDRKHQQHFHGTLSNAAYTILKSLNTRDSLTITGDLRL